MSEITTQSPRRSVQTTPEKPRRSMKKAVIAGALGLALLAGGGATFANWYQNQPINGSAITAGQLKLSAPAVTGTGWTVQHVTNEAGTTWGTATAVTDINAFRMVPGDRLTYTATVTATLQGNNLKANLIADTSGLTGTDLRQYLKAGDPTTSLVYNSAAIANPLTAPSDGTVLTMSNIQVTVTLEFPYTGTTPNGNEGQTLTVDLTKIQLKLTQIAQ